jgi:putative membrane protein
MSKTIATLFSKEELKQIEDAVKNAETQTSGEIVPFAVYASDGYEIALWRAGMLFGVITLLFFILFHRFSNTWQPFELMQVALGTLSASLLGALLARFVEPMKRLFAGKDEMDRAVSQRAAEAFLSEEVFNTKDRTGILLFLSLLEHKVVVLGDSGINAKVQQSDWENVVKTIVNGMKTNKAATGLVEAIHQCGELLSREGVSIRKDDTNELSNKMRTSDQ